MTGIAEAIIAHIERRYQAVRNRECEEERLEYHRSSAIKVVDQVQTPIQSRRLLCCTDQSAPLRRV
jgi:hypothetical protein